MVKWLCLLVCTLLLAAAGCSFEEQTAETFLQHQGLTIPTKTSSKSSITVTAETASSLGAVWAVSGADPGDYMGKTISCYTYEVKDHPLSRLYGPDSKILATVMVGEGRPIGGYASVEGTIGGTYSLEGKTLEEVTGLSYAAWLEGWTARFGPRLPVPIATAENGTPLAVQPLSPGTSPSEGYAALISQGKEIPVLPLDSMITLSFEETKPEDLAAENMILRADGTPRYTDREIQSLYVQREGETYTFKVPAIPAAMLSSNSEDYKPGACIRGVKVTCRWQVDASIVEREYVFLMRTDAS